MKIIKLLFLFLSQFSLYSLTSNEIEQLELYKIRAEGSKYEQETLLFIEKFAKSLNIESKVEPLNNLEQFHSFSKNIELLIPGKIDSEIIYAMPLNNNNSTMIGFLLLAERLSISQPNVGARFLFLGGEKGDAPYYPLGLNRFFYSYAPLNQYIIFYFDMNEPSYHFNISSYHKSISALQTIKLALNNSSNKYFTNNFTRNSSYSYHPSRHLFYSKDRPTIVTNNIAVFSSKHNSHPPIVLEQWSRDFADLLLHSHLSTTNISAETDINYLFLIYFFISESIFIFIYILLLLLFILLLSNKYSLINRKLKHLSHSFWQYFLLFIIFFTFLFISTLTLGNVSTMKNDINFWRYIPLPFATFKLSLALFLTIYSFRMLRDILLPSKNYGAVSILFGFLNLAFFTVWQLSYATPWLCFIIFSFFAFYSKKIFLVLLFTLLSLIPLLLFFLNFFINPNYDFIEFILFSSSIGNLFIIITFFPPLLLLLAIYQSKQSMHSKKYRRLLLSIFFTSALVSALFIIYYQPYSNLFKDKQPIFIHYLEDLNIEIGSVQLLSPTYMNSLNLVIDGLDYPLTSIGRSVELRLPTIRNIELTSKSTPLLSRKKVDIEISMTTAPKQIKLLLMADKAIGVIDSNYPITLNHQLLQKNQATIFIGANPPVPLIVELITEKDIRFQLEVSAFIEDDSILIDDRFDLHQKHTVIKTFSLE